MTKGSNTIISDAFNKISKKGDVLFILSGTCFNIERVVETYPNVEGNLKCSGFIVEDNQVKWIGFGEDGAEVSTCDYSETSGSGSDHAITALDMGATAREAVEMACKRDPFSGGVIQVINV